MGGEECQERVVVTEEHVTCGCEEVIACKMVVVTAFSDNHFEEAKDFLDSMQTHTHRSLTSWCTGEDKLDYFNSLCNIKVVDFEYSKYPEFVLDLNKFSWKLLIVE